MATATGTYTRPQSPGPSFGSSSNHRYGRSESAFKRGDEALVKMQALYDGLKALITNHGTALAALETRITNTDSTIKKENLVLTNRVFILEVENNVLQKTVTALIDRVNKLEVIANAAHVQAHNHIHAYNTGDGTRNTNPPHN